MKEVRHRVHEELRRARDLGGVKQAFRVGAHLREGAIAPEAFSEALGVAVLAPLRDLRAARHGVPRLLGPFDGRDGGQKSGTYFLRRTIKASGIIERSNTAPPNIPEWSSTKFQSSVLA